MIIEWLGNSGKALYEPSVMTHEAEEGPNLCVSLWWCIFHDGLYIDVAGTEHLSLILGEPNNLSPLRRDYT